MTAATARSPDHTIAPFFHERWSPRAFTGEPLPLETLQGLFEAARWAPSAANSQPWRFVYGLRGTPAFERLHSLLLPANQLWAERASALVALTSFKLLTLPGADAPVPSPYHSFDAGAAWAQLALQAHLWGWSAHALGGVDRERARTSLQVPDDQQVEVFIAIGRRGDAAVLPEAVRLREQPNGRRPVAELVFEGTFRRDGALTPPAAAPPA
ncbi:MAG: nitroreductase family protein [Anaeromyxobacter sp.]